MRRGRYAAARAGSTDRVGSSAVPGNPRPRANRPVPLAGLAAALAVPPPVGADPSISGITHASGEVRPGDIYAALPGARRHGAEFVADAAGRGAVAVLTDPAGAAAAEAAGMPALIVPDPRHVLGPLAAIVYGEPSRQLTMIGLTGTAGKTSTAYLVESGLRAAGQSTGLIGTVETRLGDLVVSSARTTPEATDLHAMLAVAQESGVHSVVMEVSSHALALDRVGGVRFAVGGYTNFGSDHLDFHTDSADYFAAKARLFDGRCAVEVLNHDDPALAPLRRPYTVTYSATAASGATWRAAAISDDGYRQHFIALGPDGISIEAGVGLPGRHNVANALLAIATLVAVGVDPATAAAGVAACPGVPGRLERVTAAGPVLGVVDYAHKSDAIVAVLAALRGLSDSRRGRLICVVGAGGDRDRGKRPTMGDAAARGADLVIVTDDNPRTEDPATIRAQVRRGADAVAGAEVVEIAGRRAAIDEAVRLAGASDVIAVLGKGHEQGQEINGDIQPFDDRIELAAALTARFGALVVRA
ncbi:UDP-N-acetylmuramoyl-L-alanyl-D-glutamate--2,6-diaminopimelate ligase [Micromonospora sp. NBC_01813]|uniref:UDP-N-acetylmuramoyl-L-alanyl-D-glutamate--2, 6-diaminopimelate ligase n=1 Tax=Micromonospora sp. NBC_01813 TaxID=2975988 RepID=UPI002DDA0616|nr:UDP-N-acetylmuramoyl-L-alanyl-D-glutamate--2,6-diaminopimelate ligase [Micromonospora sp. NBC_01813]WSA09679.1 UDP-N-acetylmuramoyl-L-alanyl-D-glutamate--2,6-diaminopimelate ligase [Micromonospora sp. NBC_01813]